ncbi:MAG: FecR domain-containing protein [Fibrobacterota bacterium]
MKHPSRLLFLGLLAVLVMAAGDGKPAPAGRLVKMKGPLERNARGSVAWTFVDSLDRVADSDRFRTGARAFARFALPGGLGLFQNEQTAIRLESAVHDPDRIHLNHLTLFYGNAFLHTEDDSAESFQHQAVTPQASVTTRGTSAFALTVNPENGLTTVYVLAGVVSVKHLQFEKTLTVSAGKKIYVDMGREIDRSDPLDSLDLRALGWIHSIDSGRIRKEIKAETVRHERIKAVLSGDRDDRILICRFQNKSEYGGLWAPEKGLPAMIADALQRSLGVTAEATDSVATDTFFKSQRNKRGLILTGVVDTFLFSEDIRTGSNNETIRALTCKLSLRLTLISPQDRRTLTAFTVSDMIRDRESPSQTYKDLVDRPFDLSDDSFANSVAGRTIQRLLKEITARLKEPLAY